MLAVMDDADPLPENWSARDSHDTFYEYVALYRQQWLAGELDLPPMFRPRNTIAQTRAFAGSKRETTGHP